MNRRELLGVTAVLALLAVSSTELEAQEGFFFGYPKGQVTLRAEGVRYDGSGDLFDFFRSELTLDESDFRAPLASAEGSFFVHPRASLSAGVGYSRMDRRSEFREWVDQDGLPIEQTTTLEVAPISLSGRLYLLDRGRSVSSLAWLPARTVPYVGAGAGWSWYRLRQSGDFVASNLDVFSTTYEGSDVVVTVHGLAGIEHWVSSRVGLSLEGRYTRGSEPPVGDFVSWDSIDLGGLQVGLGISYRW